MSDNPRANATIREFLRKEIPGWVEAGLLTEIAAQDLRGRYGLDKPEQEAAGLLSIVIMSIGGLFVGGGVISVVAANWEALPAAAKIAGMFAILLGAHAASVWLARSGRTRVAHAFSIIGCLTMGAGIGLMAQIYHIPKYDETAFGIWAIGSLAIAWAFPSAAVGTLALVLSWWWFGAEQPRWNEAALIWRAYPLIIAAAVLPLAIERRSRPFFVFTLVTVLVSAAMVGGMRTGLLGLVALALFAWALGAALSAREAYAHMGQTARTLGFAGLAVAAYFWSFRWPWKDHTNRNPLEDERIWGLVPAGIAAALAIAFAMFAVTQRNRDTGGVPVIVFRLVCAAGALLAAIGTLALFTPGGYPLIAPIVTNTAAFLLACAAIASGFSAARRGHFWAGTTLLVLLIATRFLEFQTLLIVKGMVFIGLGVAVMYGGIEYERFLKRRREAQAAS